MIEGLSQVWALFLTGSKIDGLDVDVVFANVWTMVLSLFNGWGGNPTASTFGTADLCVVLGTVCAVIFVFLILGCVFGIFRSWARGR